MAGACDNGAFVVQSFRADDSQVTVSFAGNRQAGSTRTNFTITVPPHSYLVFPAETGAAR